MGVFEIDLKGELGQMKGAVRDVVRQDITPMIEGAIRNAGQELSGVVDRASERLQGNIDALSREIHEQRRLTKDEIVVIIDIATARLGNAIDERVGKIRAEASALVIEKVELVKRELEDAARKSRRTLYANLAISIAAATAMAIVGLLYKKVSLGQLDPFVLFRILLLSASTGTGLFALLKWFAHWRVMNRSKRNAATIAMSYLGVLRPNGASRLALASVLLLAAWAYITFFVQ
jgi:hypothetical protein